MKRLFIIGALLCIAVSSSAQELRDTLQLYYKTSCSRVDTLYMRNNESFSSFYERNLTRFNNPNLELKKVTVIGSASPDGTLHYNDSLALRRAHDLTDYLKQRLPLPESLFEVTSVGVDWAALTELVIATTDMPYRNDVLQILQKDYSHNARLLALKQTNGRKAYRWMYKHLFPLLRNAKTLVYYEEKEQPTPIEEVIKEPVVVAKNDTVVKDTLPVMIAEPVQRIDDKKSYYWALKTNALYDILLIPNVGIEFAVNMQWSVAANWMYAWWSKQDKGRYWRIYGGDVEVRRWFGKKAAEKPLQGHHLGVYGQLLTYDFELGDRGYMADKWNYAFGVSYGYSLPIAKRLNLDFNLGLGYWGGKYKEYTPVEGHYVWQSTKQRHWWGPTKAEVSLVWLLGKSNFNQQKGGRQ